MEIIGTNVADQDDRLGILLAKGEQQFKLPPGFHAEVCQIRFGVHFNFPLGMILIQFGLEVFVVAFQEGVVIFRLQRETRRFDVPAILDQQIPAMSEGLHHVESIGAAPFTDDMSVVRGEDNGGCPQFVQNIGCSRAKQAVGDHSLVVKIDESVALIIHGDGVQKPEDLVQFAFPLLFLGFHVFKQLGFGVAHLQQKAHRGVLAPFFPAIGDQPGCRLHKVEYVRIAVDAVEVAQQKIHALVMYIVPSFKDMTHDYPVQADHRHLVRDGANRRPEERGFRHGMFEQPAQIAGEHQHNPHSRQSFEGILAVRQLGIDDAIGFGKLLRLDQVVIHDDRVAAKPAEGIHPLIAGNAVVNGDRQRVASIAHIVDEALLNAVRFQVTVGDEVVVPLIAAGV